MPNVTPIYIVETIGSVVQATSNALLAKSAIPRGINYQYGRSIQILTELQKVAQGVKTETKEKNFPLFGLFQDFPETFYDGYYCKVRFPKMTIATLTKSTSPVPARYAETFKPILYPIYIEFIKQLSRNRNIVGNDASHFPHIKWD